MVGALARSEKAVQVSDEELAARCRLGDLDAFGLVYERYERQVYRHAYHLLGHRDNADDVKQETFLKAYRALPGFRHECSLHTWLLRICANLCRDRIKWQERRREVLCDPVAPAVPSATSDPVAAIVRSETAGAVRAALRGLPAAQRELIVMRDLEERSYEEMADILGCSPAGVKLRLFRARRRFRERLEPLLQARG